MKASLGDAVYALVVLVLGLAWATFLGPKSPVAEAARLEKLAEYKAFCLEQAERLPLAWDDGVGCVYAPDDLLAKGD